MKRRNFLKLGAAAGLSLVTPASRHAIASEELRQFEGPFWITINLKGAWDTTLFCDPKGDVTDGSGRGPVNRYTREDIVNFETGGRSIPLAPGTHTATGSYYHHIPRRGGEAVHFMEHLADRGLTIINGVDAGLTNHRSGEQLTVAGSTLAAFPTLPAIIAYQRLVDRDPPPNGPMPLLAFGGYDGTGNLLPATRLTRLEVLGQVTRPDTIGPPGSTDTIHGLTRRGLIDDALLSRQALLAEQTMLPSKRVAMNQLFVARAKESHVGRLLDRFDFANFEALHPWENRLERQAYVALRAFDQGLAVSANLMLPGWDTHNKNDEGQAYSMRRLFRALMFIKDEAEALGVADRLNIVIGSDFGRTTYYKSRNNLQEPSANSGKDHHSVTSWMTMLWASNVEQGIRLIGGTNDAVIARPLTGNLEFAGEGEAGHIITPETIHQNLRQLAGLTAGTVVDRYPLSPSELPFWV